MAKPAKELKLTEGQREELTHLRDHAPRPAVRERCAAMLKIADGMAGHAVACRGLLRRRAANTVYRWVAYFEQEGVPGLIAHSHGGNQRRPFRQA